MNTYNFDLVLPVKFEYDIKYFQDHYNKYYANTISIGYGDENPNNNPYFRSLMDKYDFLSDHLGWFKILPYYSFPIHIDDTTHYPRMAVLNIPVYNCDERTTTNYYDIAPDDPNWDHKEDRNNTQKMLSRASFYNVQRAGIENIPKPVYTYSNMEPVLMNVTKAHDVKNRGLKTRVVASWHVKPNKFEDCRDYLISQGLIDKP